MKLVFHGAAKEVGRSCIEVQTQGDRYLLDAGIKFKEGGLAYPENLVNLPDVDGIFISHAHEDHAGALPLLEHYKIICPIYCTKLTYGISKVLLKDSYKIARIKNLHPAYTKIDLKQVEKDVRFVKYDHLYKHRKIKFVFRNAGHVPGSAMITITDGEKKLVYTGDTKLKTTELVKGAHTFYEDVDALIIESTYGDRDLPDRAETREQFLAKIEEVIARGGSVIIPVFALGRAQDVLIMLAEKKFKAPIYFDGMAKRLTQRILTTPDPYVNNHAILDEMFNKKVIHIGSPKHREHAMKSQGIFVTTSGMVQGGPVMSYIEEMWHDPKHAILLTGFQCKRTNGRHLLDEGFIYIDGWRTYVKCEILKFGFSGHADKEDLKEIVRRVDPKKLIFQHGDPEAIEAMRSWAEKQNKWRVYAPEIGEEIEV
ncbi:MAG: MBL fold metallo-hydrolase [Nanoarchaeota archaeon]|nr:MBL fold metallo-hydrolase [Nanoarchaeota archaeon]MBU1321445.1 MBL fold metallo-hydrolase [Nanoarchaeota archaeon]MBU1596901.1 MBL fold metallo-hydrolase [Nanoarchaeota archaeon]MBU2441562.1 MBL fold metallo-hydrolase [Nanoarchaeota archaeon]